VNQTDDEARPAARAVPGRALLTLAQLARLAPLLPQQPKTGSRGGRLNNDHRHPVAPSLRTDPSRKSDKNVQVAAMLGLASSK
jgi:hypothetical protein